MQKKDGKYLIIILVNFFDLFMTVKNSVVKDYGTGTGNLNSIVPNSSVPLIFTGIKWNTGILEQWNINWNIRNIIGTTLEHWNNNKSFFIIQFIIY